MFVMEIQVKALEKLDSDQEEKLTELRGDIALIKDNMPNRNNSKN